jgi:hypothetical protein
MLQRRAMKSAAISGAAMLAAAMAQSAHAQVDNVGTIITTANAIESGTSLATFGYDPINDRAYVASNFNANQSIRLVNNVGGAQTFQTQISEAAWLRFEKGSWSVGSTTADTYGGGSPIPGGFLLNPKAIASLGIPAYSSLWVTDASTVVTTPTQAPNLTERVYRYNLGQEPATGDAANEMNSVMTLAQFQTGAGTTTTTTNVSRQFAWSGDGQSIYFIDSGTSNAFGGVWKESASGGVPTRLLAIGTIDTNTEPAVTTSAGVDTIYFKGGTITGNAGGIDKITHDGVNTTARAVAVPAAAIADFLELSAGTVAIASMAADANGNIYFNNTDSTSGRRGIYEYDNQGRFSKVLSYADRQTVFGGTPNSNTLRIQPRTITYNNGTASFQITQLLYAESTPINLVAGANVFTPGDFNRDGVIDQTDIGLFKAKLTVKAGPALAAADSRYDLNGNGICSYKDVRVLQSYYGFYDGDCNMDKTVDLTDFTFLAANFNKLSGQRWLEGDFNGDEAVDLTDFTFLAANFNKTFPASSAGIGAAVPEPAMMSLLSIGVAAILAPRRRSI